MCRLCWNTENGKKSNITRFFLTLKVGSTLGLGGAKVVFELGGNIEGHLIQYHVNMVGIIDTDNVLPIMHFQNNGYRRYNNVSYFVTAEDAIFGVRYTRSNARTVLLGISTCIITDENVRQTLIENILDWLVGKVSVEN